MPTTSTRPTPSTPTSAVIAPRIGIAALAALAALPAFVALFAFAEFIVRCSAPPQLAAHAAPPAPRTSECRPRLAARCPATRHACTELRVRHRRVGGVLLGGHSARPARRALRGLSGSKHSEPAS